MNVPFFQVLPLPPAFILFLQSPLCTRVAKNARYFPTPRPPLHAHLGLSLAYTYPSDTAFHARPGKDSTSLASRVATQTPSMGRDRSFLPLHSFKTFHCACPSFECYHSRAVFSCFLSSRLELARQKKRDITQPLSPHSKPTQCWLFYALALQTLLLPLSLPRFSSSR